MPGGRRRLDTKKLVTLSVKIQVEDRQYLDQLADDLARQSGAAPSASAAVRRLIRAARAGAK